jgi:hypothetical protein
MPVRDRRAPPVTSRISVSTMKRTHALTVRLGSVLMAGLALSACGGRAATKKDVIARGNQICETAASAVREVAPPTGGSLTALARYYQRVTPIVATEARQLRDLPRPAQDRAVLNRYLAAIASSAIEYEALATAAQKGDRGALSSASAALRANPAGGLAVRYGIAGCGESSGTAAS